MTARTSHSLRRVLLAALFCGATVLTTAAMSTTAGAADDPFALPEGGPAELLKFVEETAARRPEGITSGEQLIDYLSKSRSAIVQATDKILADDSATAEQQAAAAEYKVKALELMYRLGDRSAAEQLNQFAEELTKSPQKGLRQLGQSYTLVARGADLYGSQDKQAVEQLLKDVSQYIQEAEELTVEHLQLAMQTAITGEIADNVNEATADAYRIFGEAFSKSDDPQLQFYGKKLLGGAVRLNLVGKPIEIEGGLFGGGQIKWDDYRGKVVLVDFWATFCGPCLAELPHVKELYEEYHEQGFDVVGISLDDEKATLAEFMQQNPLPWPTLFSEDPEAAGMDHPLATKYGIMAIPVAILVDREGNVVSLNARGEELTALLEQQFPAADGKDKPAAQ